MAKKTRTSKTEGKKDVAVEASQSAIEMEIRNAQQQQSPQSQSSSQQQQLQRTSVTPPADPQPERNPSMSGATRNSVKGKQQDNQDNIPKKKKTKKKKNQQQGEAQEERRKDSSPQQVESSEEHQPLVLREGRKQESQQQLVQRGENQQLEPQSSFRGEWPSEYRELRNRSFFRDLFDTISQLRYNCGMLVNNGHVQFWIIILISVNAIMIGIGTFPVIADNPRVNQIFDDIDLIFLIIFTVELGMQFIYHSWRLLLDGWLVFDLVIIVTSWSFAQVQIVRAFRIFRALRLVTRIKVMKNLILALFGVMPRLAAIGLMLGLIFYIFAVMFTQLFKDIPRDALGSPYFDQIDHTLFTLYQMMTLDNWADIAREIMDFYSWAWGPFVIYVIISGFIVVNLIIAVICDAISALHEDDKARIHGHFDHDHDGTDSYDGSSQELEIREQLDSLELQMEELTRLQAQTFHTLQYLTRHLQMQKLKAELKVEGEKKPLKRASSRRLTTNSLTSSPKNSLTSPPKNSLTSTPRKEVEAEIDVTNNTNKSEQSPTTKTMTPSKGTKQTQTTPKQKATTKQ